MRTRKLKRRRKFISVVLLCAALCCLFSNFDSIAPMIVSAAEDAASFAALAILPEGGAVTLERQLIGNGDAVAVVSQIETTIKSGNTTATTTKKVETTQKQAQPLTTIPNSPFGKVLTMNYQTSGYSFKFGNVYVSNRTKSHTFDIKKELALRPDITIVKNAKPQVLIVHTHATESYLFDDNGQYNKNYSARSTDNSKNMVRVGEEIKKQLDKAGIVTIQDKTQHDYPSYNGGYDRSAATIKKYLAKYPSIEVVLDIHRDAITKDDGTKIKPTAIIGGKKAAQIMICAGCQDGPVTSYKDWEYNLRFALRIQKQCNDSYQGLVRPLLFLSKKYNEYLCRGSLLIEMGSDSNTLSEAIYSGELLGKSLVTVLNGLQKGKK